MLKSSSMVRARWHLGQTPSVERGVGDGMLLKPVAPRIPPRRKEQHVLNFVACWIAVWCQPFRAFLKPRAF